MTRLQKVLCLALGLLGTTAVLAATVVHTRAESGRRALGEADRAHTRWGAERAREQAAWARLRDIAARQVALSLATADTTRRLEAIVARTRNARRKVVLAPPRVVVRVSTVAVADHTG